MKVASSLTNTISSSGTTAISSTQAYNTAATFTAAAAKANRVQPELSSQVLSSSCTCASRYHVMIDQWRRLQLS